MIQYDHVWPHKKRWLCSTNDYQVFNHLYHKVCLKFSTFIMPAITARILQKKIREKYQSDVCDDTIVNIMRLFGHEASTGFSCCCCLRTASTSKLRMNRAELERLWRFLDKCAELVSSGDLCDNLEDAYRMIENGQMNEEERVEYLQRRDRDGNIQETICRKRTVMNYSSIITYDS